jgi:uncharacterized protein (TIGR00290 family)
MRETPVKTLLAWSSGKDSAYALWKLRQDPTVEVVGLLTTMNSSVDRVSMHASRASVLEAQARAAGLTLLTLPLPDPCSDEEYRATMGAAIAEAKDRGVEAIAFGDLFLDDVRSYRESQLADTGIVPLFPLWGEPTELVAHRLIDAGFRAIITCVDSEQLCPSFAGRHFDYVLLEDLPTNVDPCGENGEFHTVVVAGPCFESELHVEIGAAVERGRFTFVDVMLRDSLAGPLGDDAA